MLYWGSKRVTSGLKASLDTSRFLLTTRTRLCSHLQRAVLGLVRDLRGIVYACTNRQAYMLIFDWLYPERMPVRAVGAPCMNRMQRGEQSVRLHAKSCQSSHLTLYSLGPANCAGIMAQ